MTPSARLAAAIDVLALIEAQRRPAAEALTEWGRAHRFAGSKDRAAIAALLYDALRCRASSTWIMDDPSPRGVLLGSLREAQGLDAAAVAALCTGEGHAPAPLTSKEQDRLETGTLDNAPSHVAGNFPEWLEPMLAAALGDGLVAEMRALAQRAPVDLRVNVPRLTRDKAREALSHFGAVNTPRSPFGLRIIIGADGRAPPLAAERTFLKGLFEVQDEGSQLAAMLSGAAPGEQVLDLCAGAGGKTLAMAALMEGRGQVYAYDGDGRRLAPIFARIERSGARNIQVRSPKGRDGLSDLLGRCDLVLVDAPCTGTGTWRRHPDAKWRVRPGALEQRVKQQDEVLAQAAPYVKPGGRIAYVTCSLLREENESRVEAFLGAHREFAEIPVDAVCAAAGLRDLAACASSHGAGLRLSPATTGTDGFYIALLRRNG